MLRLSALLFGALIFAQGASAQWQVVSSQHEQAAAPGIEYLHVELRDGRGNGDANFDLAFFSKFATLKVIDNPTGSDSAAEGIARENCIAGVNGGYFDPSFKPLGLRVENGVTTAPLTRSHLLTGILCASPRGVQILRLAEPLPKKCTAAIECGPFLLDRGAAVKGLDDNRLAKRTFAAVTRPDGAAIGICRSAVTLAQMAQALTAVDFGRGKVSRALNLDGGSSTAFWLRRGDGDAISVSEDKAVRDFIGVGPK